MRVFCAHVFPPPHLKAIKSNELSMNSKPAKMPQNAVSTALSSPLESTTYAPAKNTLLKKHPFMSNSAKNVCISKHTKSTFPFFSPSVPQSLSPSVPQSLSPEVPDP